MVAKKSRVVIVGAGMASLTTANRLYVTVGAVIDVTVVEEGDRIGGCILTSDFAGDCVEMGTTWIHSIVGSPIYVLADKIDVLTENVSYEWMDDFPEDHLTVSESGVLLTPSFLEPISSLYRNLMDSVKDGLVVDGHGRG